MCPSEARQGLLPILPESAHTCPRIARVVIASVAILLWVLLLAQFAPAARAANLVQPAPNCVELVVNGGFEQTVAGWNSVAGASLFSYANDKFVGGRQSLLLGFTVPVNITTTFGVEQLLALPAESTNLELTFQYAATLVTEAAGEQVDGGSTPPSDSAFLTLVDATSQELLAMSALAPTDDGWSGGRYDLTPLAGREVWLTFAVINDGESESLSLHVDDVSILACLPADALAVQAPPTVPAPATTAVPPAATIFPQAATVSSLEACSCSGSLYSCSNFSSWAVAQACFTHCQVSAGYDIHNLDPDRNGVACELELDDVPPLDALPEAPPSTTGETPGAIVSPTNSLDPNPVLTPSVGAGFLITDGSAVAALPVGAAPRASVPAASSEITSAASVTLTGDSVMGVTDGSVVTPTSEAVPADVSPAAIAAAPAASTGANALPTPLPATTEGASPTPNLLSSFETLSLLLFSPLGYVAIAVLVTVGALTLWVAYMLGQRGKVLPSKTPQDQAFDDFAAPPHVGSPDDPPNPNPRL